jgi:hypothetical protein
MALKDIRLALAEAEAANVPMPSVSVVRDRIITGLAHGYTEFDWSVLALVAAEAAGNRKPSRCRVRLRAASAALATMLEK